MKRIIIMFFILSISMFTYAYDTCDFDDYYCTNTTLGKMDKIKSSKSKDGYSHIFLNGKELFKAKTRFFSDVPNGWTLDFNNKVSKTIVFFDRDEPIKTEDGQYKRRAYVLLDFSSNSGAVISKEFFPGTDFADIKWVSWGKESSVIIFNDGSKFKYSNGSVLNDD